MKIAALAPFPFANGEFGGAERIDNLLTSIKHPVRVFIANSGATGIEKYKNLEMVFVKIPQDTGASEYDFAVSRSAKECFGELLSDYDPDLVILEHPWQVQAIDGQKFVYDAHNNEAEIKRLIRGDAQASEAGQLEALALDADHVTFCSESDKLTTNSPTTWIPNGTEWPNAKNSVGKASKVLLFSGSAHPPNIGAAITLAGLAPALQDYEIVITGSCSEMITGQAPNVHLLGHVTKKTLNYLMRTAHAFVNPIAAGSGTSLKVIKSLSYGLPVISSSIGARGYEDGCIVAKTAQEVIDSLERLKSPSEWEMASERSVAFARPYSWEAVGAKFNQVIEGLL